MHTAPMITNKMTGEEMAALQAVAKDKKSMGRRNKGEREREREEEIKQEENPMEVPVFASSILIL